MLCPNCNHQNEGGKFCEKCGTSLIAKAAQETAASVDIPQTNTHAAQAAQSQPNQYLEATKKISKTYFAYFIQVLKKPFASAQGVGSEHLVNGIITIALYSFIIPLMIYFAVKGILSSVNDFGSDLFGEDVAINPPFMDMVLKPTFAFAVFILLVATFSFAAVRLGRINASFSEVIARFGSFLIPFTAILAVALIMSFLKIKMFVLLLFIGFVGSIFIVPPLVISSYKKDSKEGVDVIYGTLITFVLTFIAMGMMGDMLFQSIFSAISDLYDQLNMF
jgi:hypothetical protein